MKITEKMIKSISSETVYKRGMEFFRDGRIHIKSISENAVRAVADGDELYNISIKTDGDKVCDYYCTCRYYSTMGSACKHIAATLEMCRNMLENGANFENENDKLASALCGEYAARSGIKEKIKLIFGLNISTQSSEKIYSVDIKAGVGEPETVSSAAFIRGIINEKKAVLSKHRRLDLKRYDFGEKEKRILDILAETEENNRREINERGGLYVGSYTLGRLLAAFSEAECEYRVDGIPCPDLRIIDDDPDILVDVGANANRVSMVINERGTALTDDGEWFLFEGNIYHTSREWRAWFMPIYNTVIEAKRTQIDFVADNAVEFVTSVLPEITGRRGVVLNGFEDVIVDTKPRFEAVIQKYKNGISVMPLVYYGSICLKLTENTRKNDKILIRNDRLENEVKTLFAGFETAGERYVTTDEDLMFEFLSNGLPKLETYARVIFNDRFSVDHNADIKVNVGHRADLDLLEVGFETTLSEEEIFGILEAVRLKKSYYRRSDGTFFAPDSDDFSVAVLLNGLGFSRDDIREGKKQVTTNHAFYLSELAKNKLIGSGESFKRFMEKIENTDVAIPKQIESVLRGYQKVGVKWLYRLSRCGFGGILADDMGLGKTLQVIAFVMSVERDKPVLVVTPSSLTYNWQSEIAKFAPDATSVIVEGVKEERASILENCAGVDFVITSYPLMRRDMELYRKTEFSYFFIDEAQYIKNPATINAKSVKKIKAGAYFALTGTPIENSLGELWSIFDFVMRGYLGSQREFSARYQGIVKDGDSGAAGELRKKIRPFILRRLKKDVLKELPEKIENTVYAGLESEQKKLYEAYLKVARNEISYMGDMSGENRMRILSLLMRLRQICCHPRLFDAAYKDDSGKLLLFEELVSSGVSAGHRILVFSQFTSMLAIIKESLEKLGISYFYLDGSTHNEERIELANRFNAGERDVFLISLKAGGTGLNLTGADMVIHYDPWWNPAVMDQASDRAHRIGQKKAVQVIKLAAKGTIEEQIIKLQEKKRALADDVIRESAGVPGGFTKEDIIAIFS